MTYYGAINTTSERKMNNNKQTNIEYLESSPKMRLSCEVSVINRNQPQQNNRQIKSMISIGYHMESEKKSEMFLLYENLQKKSGQRYKIKSNVMQLFTKFIKEGKATIRFQEPPHDLLIQCDTIRLSAFMSAFRMGLTGDSNFKSLGKQINSSIRDLPVLTRNSFPVKSKIVVKNRSDVDKIPKTVEDLNMTGLGLSRFLTSFLLLKNLTKLNLSENNLTEIPAGFGYLPLADINFAQNQLFNSNFAWLNQHNIQTTLRSINLSDNKLRFFPVSIIKIPKLKVIKLSNNQIQGIPFAIRTLKNLREFNIDKNKLESLPDALSWINFEIIDISDNPFKPIDIVTKEDVINRICVKPNINLTEMCMRRVIQQRLPYTPATLPRSIVDLLEESPLCSCGSICLATPMLGRWHEAKLKSNSIIKTSRVSAYGDGTFCSLRCIKRYY